MLLLVSLTTATFTCYKVFRIACAHQLQVQENQSIRDCGQPATNFANTRDLSLGSYTP